MLTLTKKTWMTLNKSFDEATQANLKTQNERREEKSSARRHGEYKSNILHKEAY